MNDKQIEATRAKARAAYAAGDMAKYQAEMDKIHAHAAAESERFAKSDAGRAFMNRLIGRP
jgi:hypothetical protein